jgi:hypothetical protein
MSLRSTGKEKSSGDICFLPRHEVMGEVASEHFASEAEGASREAKRWRGSIRPEFILL